MTTKPVQMLLDLPVRAALGRDDFYVSPANAEALAQIDAWSDWPAARLVLVGPEGAGKTHLAHVWAGRAGAQVRAASDLGADDLPALAERGPLVLEDPDRGVDEATLFHLMNLMAAGGQPLLLTARTAPSRWSTALPDLRSRLEAAAIASLQAPDDTLLTRVIEKQFADRQLTPPASLIPYLIRRIERSFSAAQWIVAQLDATSLANKQPITRSLAAQILDKAVPNTP